jgi:hypothetical protein
LRLKAYILAADPNWIESSVMSYYDCVDEIVVSYDRNGRGWSGQPIPVDECLARLEAIDKDKKLHLLGGDYYRPQHSAMENDTYQRQCAVDTIGTSADWIVELDTDEVLPNATRFVECLASVPRDRMVVEWPMRVFFQRTRSGKFLEVTTFFRQQKSEFPGPAATRPGVRLDCARQSSTAPRWRFDIRRNARKMGRPANSADAAIDDNDAILHFSWVRSDADLLRKVTGWSHSKDFNGQRYYRRVWKAAPRIWPFLYNFHPLAPRVWPALWPAKLDGRIQGP